MDGLHTVAEGLLCKEDQGEGDLQTIIADIKTTGAADVSDKGSDNKDELPTSTTVLRLIKATLNKNTLKLSHVSIRRPPLYKSLRTLSR